MSQTQSLKISIIVSAIMLSTPVPAKTIADYRHTIFVQADQQPLVFQAPDGGCFLDQTADTEKVLYSTFQEKVERSQRKKLLAVFTDCSALNDIEGNVSAEGKDNIIMNSGVILWTKPETKISWKTNREIYLNHTAPSFISYTQQGIKNKDANDLDEDFYQNNNGLYVGISTAHNSLYSNEKSSAVFAKTLIKKSPIEIFVRNSDYKSKSQEEVYNEIDRFVALQIQLNE